jgi:hypothetical protein
MITKTRVLSIVAILTIAMAISTLITTNTLAAKSRHPSHPSAMNSTSGFAKINNDTNSVTIGSDSSTHHGSSGSHSHHHSTHSSINSISSSGY